MSNFVFQAAITLVPFILSITVHEWAHAWTATRLGDDTAARQGRLTLSPDKHIDIFGSIIVPLIGIVLLNGMLFGWAKPVPVNPSGFKREISMKRGMLLVALAGPMSNLLLAILCGVALKVMYLVGGEALFMQKTGEAFGRLLGLGVTWNVLLFAFNFVPIPPLDGSKILAGVLPDDKQWIVEWLERHQMMLFLVFLLFGLSLFFTLIMGPLRSLLVVLLGLNTPTLIGLMSTSVN